MCLDCEWEEPVLVRYTLPDAVPKMAHCGPRKADAVIGRITGWRNDSRSEAARLGNVTLQIVRDCVVRFNAEGPMGCVTANRPAPRRRWARRGTRPVAPQDQRYVSTYILGAVFLRGSRTS